MTMIHGRCPRCCPEGGAIFTRTYEPNSEGQYVPHKRCNNCRLLLPIRKPCKPKGPNARQRRIIGYITEQGWTIVQQMIGRKVWISAKHPTRGMWNGDGLYGTIGAYGKVDLTLQRIGTDKKLVDCSDIHFYLRREG